jgi:hypothetical protein
MVFNKTIAIMVNMLIIIQGNLMQSAKAWCLNKYNTGTNVQFNQLVCSKDSRKYSVYGQNKKNVMLNNKK